MDQHEWVRGCLAYYEENNLTPEPGGEWQEAHYPAPKGVGTEVIWLMRDHHQVQGLLQSEEYGRFCFFNYETLGFLNCGPFVPGWFELWDLYDKWSGNNGRKMAKVMLAHPNTIASRFETVKAMNEHPNTKKYVDKVSKRILLTDISTGESLEFPSAHEAALTLGLSRGSLCNVARGERKHHKGYTAVYLADEEDMIQRNTGDHEADPRRTSSSQGPGQPVGGRAPC